MTDEQTKVTAKPKRANSPTESLKHMIMLRDRQNECFILAGRIESLISTILFQSHMLHNVF